MTTAATIYLTAGIGVAVAVERIALASEITAFAVLLLFVVGWIERSFERWHSQHP